MNYSFCESVFATSTSKWHIRPLTIQGKKLGGGIDTDSLCGLVTTGWDLDVEINEFHLRNNICDKCEEEYFILMGGEK